MKDKQKKLEPNDRLYGCSYLMILNFMEMAEVASKMSIFPGTKVGSLFIKDKRIISTGFNGSPSKFPDDKYLSDLTKEDRLLFTTHAEQNGVANAARNGISLKDSICICTYSPCLDCAKLLINSGIIAIVTNEVTDSSRKFFESQIKAIELFFEVGMEYYVI